MIKGSVVEFLMERLSSNDCMAVPSDYWNQYIELVEYAKEAEKIKMQEHSYELLDFLKTHYRYLNLDDQQKAKELLLKYGAKF